MKLEEHVIEREQIELPAGQYSETYALKVIGKTRLHKGHTIFMINLITGEMTIAKIAKTNLFITKFADSKMKEFKKDEQVEVPEDCIPICALNKKNALKKFYNIAKQLFPENE